MRACDELKTSLEALTSVDDKAFYLYEFWLANRGNHLELIKEYLEEIKKKALVEENNFALGWYYYILGWMEIDQGNFNESFPYLEQAREKFEEHGDKWALSNTINGFAANYFQLGIFDKALEHFLVALELAEEAQDRQLASTIAMNIGSVFAELRQYSEALYYYEEVMTEYPSVPSEKAIMICTIGNVYKSMERYEEALEKFFEALALGQEGAGAVFALQEIASTYKLLEQNDLAYKYYKKCLELAQKGKSLHFIATSLLNLGIIEKERGQIDLAQKYLEEALEASEQTTSESLRVKALKDLAGLYREIGRAEDAYDYLDEVNKYQEKSFNEELVNNIGILKVKQARRENLIYRDLYDRINTISSIGRTITASLNIEEMNLSVYNQLNELLSADNLLIGLYIEESSKIDYRIVIKKGKKINGFIQDLSKKESIESKCLEEKKALILNGLSTEREEENKESSFAGVNSLLCCPLLIRDEIVGFMMVQSKKKEAYSEHHLDILNALAAYIVIALENSKLFSDVQKLATRDSLTNLPNRRYIFSEARKAFSHSKRYASPLTVVVADLDKFKTINDTFGHDVGDLVLKTTAKIFAENIRDVDFVGRIGGEEFLFVLPHIGLEEARILSTRLCEILKVHQYNVNQEQFHVTASFGLAQVLDFDVNVEETIKRADRAQYEAKKLGRARVMSDL